jgi:hypothetical protein
MQISAAIGSSFAAIQHATTISAPVMKGRDVDIKVKNITVSAC